MKNYILVDIFTYEKSEIYILLIPTNRLTNVKYRYTGSTVSLQNLSQKKVSVVKRKVFAGVFLGGQNVAELCRQS